ncbi:hypothetical protein ASD11_11560 [Aeromicrobium sp. Root495]|uniref:maleylpyruvate isomerase family mycothiol-dependent enzyme n=1 Tax=Aeromicrobium sp. Root495 TaxID=1736550 RepID=UPI0006FAF06A|nr:maleylpyruvate isomerase family mycothiol-dependent enzyme [Aeromicrobium sp. Root495]KQY60122.1 hypothetical protein ASD11_11560 [Aeromicrobium sp. Root495]
MTGIDTMDELATTMGRFAEALDGADETADVPACPGWTVRDLAVHVGTVHRWAAAIVLSGQQVREPEPVVVGPLAPWYASCATALLGALQAVEPTEQVPNFSRLDETAAFWPRRQLHETTVHLADLLQATGHGTPAVPPAIAADGVSEVLRTFFARLTGRGMRPVLTGTVRLEATDTGDVWALGPGDGHEPPPLLDASAPAAATVRGTASDLYLGIWRRVPHDVLVVDGSAAEDLLAGPLTA